MINVEVILHKLESLGMLRLHKITGDYYQIYCPIHKDGQEKKPSCGVLLHDMYKGGQKYTAGWTHCFTCHYSKSLPDLISDLLMKHNINQSGLDWLKENIPDFNPDVDVDYLMPTGLVETLVSNLAIDFFKKLKTNERTYVSEEELQQYRYIVPYMYERKMTDEAIERFDVGFDAHYIPPGWDKEVPCITMPVRDILGRTLFICRRSIEGKFFSYPQGTIKSLYGIDLIPEGCKSLIIVESCINAITCFVYGYTAVALLGTGNNYQIDQLRSLGIREFVLCMDNDPAGKKGAAKLKRGLQDVAIVWTVNMPEGKDVNDCSKLEFDALYNTKI